MVTACFLILVDLLVFLLVFATLRKRWSEFLWNLIDRLDAHCNPQPTQTLIEGIIWIEPAGLLL